MKARRAGAVAAAVAGGGGHGGGQPARRGRGRRRRATVVRRRRAGGGGVEGRGSGQHGRGAGGPSRRSREAGDGEPADHSGGANGPYARAPGGGGRRRWRRAARAVGAAKRGWRVGKCMSIPFFRRITTCRGLESPCRPAIIRNILEFLIVVLSGAEGGFQTPGFGGTPSYRGFCFFGRRWWAVTVSSSFSAGAGRNRRALPPVVESVLVLHRIVIDNGSPATPLPARGPARIPRSFVAAVAVCYGSARRSPASRATPAGSTAPPGAVREVFNRASVARSILSR